MNLKSPSLAAFALFALAATVPAAKPADAGPIERADSLWAAGWFARAGAIYSEYNDANLSDYHSTVQLGRLAVYTNQFFEAESKLMRAMELKPEENQPRLSLAESYRRQDRYSDAAPLLRKSGREADAAQAESFGDSQPYEVTWGSDWTPIKFEVTDPLPVVKARINRSEEAYFLIDTGAPGVMLDSAFAASVGARRFGSLEGTFAGGKRAPVALGTVDSMAIGNAHIQRIPVHIQDLGPISGAIFPGRRLAGILGTGFLHHFLATLDYPKGQLVLRKSTMWWAKHAEPQWIADGQIMVPFVMAGDHYMVARGGLNGVDSLLYFVDTGLAGGGFSAPRSTLDRAGVKLLEDQAGEGMGGGGKVKIVPFVAEKLRLGGAEADSIRGLFSDVFPLENSLGFHIDGLISHGFLKKYAVSFDFQTMQMFLKKKP